jgi:hypothetical protein
MNLGILLKGCVAVSAMLTLTVSLSARQYSSRIGSERAVATHLTNGAEYRMTAAELIAFGKQLFTANWTEEDGAGRPLTRGNGKPLGDPSLRLSGLRTFNRVSGPDANSCAGCHNAPFGIPGGSGDFVTQAFLLAERFDFATFDRTETRKLQGSLDERGRPATLQTIGNLRSTPGLFGAGYLEMIARQMTEDLQRTRDSILPGTSKKLVTKGISFGVLHRRSDASWDVTAVEGLPPQSTRVPQAGGRPSLVVRPWHQSGSVVSLRDFTNAALNRHHGIQTVERFGLNTDADGDGVKNELTRGDVTALVLYQATLPVPGRVIANTETERQVVRGERLFAEIGCTACHIPSIPLDRGGWVYSEPARPVATSAVRPATTRAVEIDLTADDLPPPRLQKTAGTTPVVHVPAYTDFKLHDITDAADTAAAEPLDMNQPPGTTRFFAGNRRFMTRRLWAVGNQITYFHHGLFTTIREAVIAHAGEALDQRRAFERLGKDDQESILEFLNSLQALPPGTKDLIVYAQYRRR